MQSTPRPLPWAPPHLASSHSADIRSYRPLPIPPVQSADAISSIKNCYQHTHATFASSSARPSKLSFGARPKLHISVKSPILQRKSSLDSLTVRTPAFRDPGQTLAPAVTRWNNPVTYDQNWFGRALRNPERSSRVPSAKSFGSPLVFRSRKVGTEPYICEPAEGGRPVLVPRISRSEKGMLHHAVTLQPHRLQPAPIKGRTRTNYLATATRVVTYVDEEDSDEETTGRNPCSVSSIDLTNGREFCASSRKSWRSLLNTAKVAMKSCVSRCQKPQSVKSGGTPATDAKRVPQLATPLHRTWYKERGGLRWVQRDVGEVLTELRKLQ